LKVIVQRVKNSNVKVNNKIVGSINKGIMLLLGIGKDDNREDIEYLANKIVNLRIFEDENKKMNLSLKDIDGELLIISQFTIYGDCRKGRRPSFDKASKPEYAKEIYNEFVKYCISLGVKVETGEFQEHMDVSLVNDGPVTFILDTDKR
jgi:D-tyrosyl-tRNA(Tyr) deacylase